MLYIYLYPCFPLYIKMEVFRASRQASAYPPRAMPQPPPMTQTSSSYYPPSSTAYITPSSSYNHQQNGNGQYTLPISLSSLSLHSSSMDTATQNMPQQQQQTMPLPLSSSGGGGVMLAARRYVLYHDQTFVEDRSPDEKDVSEYTTFRSGYNELQSHELRGSNMVYGIPSHMKHHPFIRMYKEDTVRCFVPPSTLQTMNTPDRWVKTHNVFTPDLEEDGTPSKSGTGTWTYFRFNEPLFDVPEDYINPKDGYLMLEKNQKAQVFVSNYWSWHALLNRGIPWSCKYPERIRNIDAIPPQVSSLVFHLHDTVHSNGSFWPIKFFIEQLIKNNYMLRIEFQPSQLSDTFQYQNNYNNKEDPELFKRCNKGVIVNQMLIETLNSQLLEYFDLQLYSHNFNLHHPNKALQRKEPIPWFNPLGSNLSSGPSAGPQHMISNQVVVPGELKQPKSVYYPDTRVMDSPEFQRWIYSDMEGVKKELNTYLVRDYNETGLYPYYKIPGLSSTEVHPTRLVQFLALTEFEPRIRARADQLNSSLPKPSYIAEIKVNTEGGVSHLLISTHIMDEIITEKHTGYMDKNQWVMRYDQPIWIELKLKDRYTNIDNKNKVQKRLEDYACENGIKHAHFFMHLNLITEPYLGTFPEQ
jgi:hypothetical protein